MNNDRLSQKARLGQGAETSSSSPMTAAKTPAKPLLETMSADPTYRAGCTTGITPCLHGCHHGECYYRARPELPPDESIGHQQQLEPTEANDDTEEGEPVTSTKPSSTPETPRSYQGNYMEADRDVVLLVARERGGDPIVSLLRWPSPERATLQQPPVIWKGSISELAAKLGNSAAPAEPVEWTERHVQLDDDEAAFLGAHIEWTATVDGVRLNILEHDGHAFADDGRTLIAATVEPSPGPDRAWSFTPPGHCDTSEAKVAAERVARALAGPTAFEMQRDELDRVLKRINELVPERFDGDAIDYLKLLEERLVFGPLEIQARQLAALHVADATGLGGTMGPDGDSIVLPPEGEAEFRRIWDEHPEAREFFGVEPPESWRGMDPPEGAADSADSIEELALDLRDISQLLDDARRLACTIVSPLGPRSRAAKHFGGWPVARRMFPRDPRVPVEVHEAHLMVLAEQIGVPYTPPKPPLELAPSPTRPSVPGPWAELEQDRLAELDDPVDQPELAAEPPSTEQDVASVPPTLEVVDQPLYQAPLWVWHGRKFEQDGVPRGPSGA